MTLTDAVASEKVLNGWRGAGRGRGGGRMSNCRKIICLHWLLWPLRGGREGGEAEGGGGVEEVREGKSGGKGMWKRGRRGRG